MGKRSAPTAGPVETPDEKNFTKGPPFTDNCIVPFSTSQARPRTSPFFQSGSESKPSKVPLIRISKIQKQQ
jgi:hypothetical protein